MRHLIIILAVVSANCFPFGHCAHGAETPYRSGQDTGRGASVTDQLLAAHLLPAPGVQEEDCIAATWSYLTLGIPDRAQVVLKRGRSQMLPVTVALFEKRIAEVETAQNLDEAQILAACAAGARTSNELFSAFVTELRRDCEDRVLTNAGMHTMSGFFATNGLPVCEVSVSIRTLKEACSRNAVGELAQALWAVRELSRLSIITVVVDLTDEPLANGVRVRCWGQKELKRTQESPTENYTSRLEAGTWHSLSPHPVGNQYGGSRVSDQLARAAIGEIIQSVCIDAARFTFTGDK